MQLQNNDSFSKAIQQKLLQGILYLHCALNEEELVYNSNEPTKRTTRRGVRDLVVISPVDELDIYESLNELYDSCE